MLAWDPTGIDAVRNGATRVIAASTGALYALVFFYTLGAHPIVYAFITVVVLAALHYFNIGKFTAIASVTAVAIIPTMAGHQLAEFLARVMSTLIGIMIASIINLLVYTPTYTASLEKNSEKSWRQGLHMIASIIENEEEGHEHSRLWAQRDVLHAKLHRMKKRLHKQRTQWRLHPASPVDQQALHLTERRIDTLLRLLEHVHILRTSKSLPTLAFKGILAHFPERELEPTQLLLWLEKIRQQNKHPQLQEVISACIETLQENEQESVPLPAPSEKWSRWEKGS